ncbi:hypothetical protein [Rhizobium leguminosarum]|uniref:hypothetical protein n=1 Tax=Rhizobium leguminosarum TaxID=384 RepID=UPI002E163518|nr:hypothetical protein U8Q02_41175 [Rhizobium leguminosarum]
MTGSFTNLSVEGKLAKIAQHVDTGHPVKSEWVRWLLDEFEDGRLGVPEDGSHEHAAFASQSQEGKLAKLKDRVLEVDVPSPWVEWFLETYLPATSALKP